MLRVKQSCHQNVAHSNSLTDCITVEPTAIQLTGKPNAKIAHSMSGSTRLHKYPGLQTTAMPQSTWRPLGYIAKQIESKQRLLIKSTYSITRCSIYIFTECIDIGRIRRWHKAPPRLEQVHNRDHCRTSAVTSRFSAADIFQIKLVLKRYDAIFIQGNK